jgi:uncharacterized membrane protein (DUF373 family)
VFNRWLSTAVAVAERVIIAILVVLVALGIVGLIADAAHVLGRRYYLDLSALLHVIDHVLAVFILFELVAVARAYTERGQVIRRVLEATIVAAARKVIAFELGDRPLARAVALSTIVVAVALSWFLLSRVAGLRDELGERA